MTSFERTALRIAVFAAGALLMALEVAAFRIIGKTFGSALRETTTVIAVFLAAMSAGYWAGGRVGDRWPRPRTLVATLIIAAATLLFVPWIDSALSPRIAASNFALATHAFLATSVLFAIPTFLLAATSPIAIRLFTTSTGASGSTAGSISAISTVGSIAGSLATAFFLIDWLQSISRTVLFVALGTCATAVLVLLATMPRDGATALRRAGIGTAASAALAVLSIAFMRTSAIDQSLMQPLPGTRMLLVADSPYHRITVRQRGKIREMLFNIGIQTRMRVDDPFGPGLAYSDTVHLTPLMRPETRRVLLIGLGGGTLAKQFVHHYPNVSVDAVEVDPMVVDVARKHFALEDSPRLRVHVADGRTFLTRSRETWDLIIIDVATTNRYGDTIPAHMVTREFFADVAKHLAPSGVLHVHCAFHNTALMPALHKTVAGVFPFVIRSHGELLASSTALVIEKDVLRERAESSPVARFPNLQSAIEALSSEAPPRDARPLTDDYAPVDTLLRRELAR